MSNNEDIRNGLEGDSNNIQMGFLSLVYSLDSPFGRQHLVNIIKGVKSKKISEYQHDLLPEYGIGSSFTTNSLASVLEMLISENYLSQDWSGFHPCVMLTEKGQMVIANLSTSENCDPAPSPFIPASLVREEIIDYDRELFVKLKKYRKIESDERQLRPYRVAHDSVLKDIARIYPKSIEELISIDKFGPRLAEEYGNDLLYIVNEHCRESAGKNEEDTLNQSSGMDSNTWDSEPNKNCSNLPQSIATENKTPIETTLQRYWGYPSFHTHQKEAIEHLLNGSDVLFLMATGGGKSLCYQLPAVHTGGLTVVISPLIALMKDQVDDLLHRGIPAATINSTMGREYNELAEKLVCSGKISLLYVSPEKFLTSTFLEFLHTTPLSMIAIDEAHCISMWGHEFRTDYRELSLIKQEFPTIPVIAMTATATKVVREDIVIQLGMKHPKVFIGSFNRKNLYYEIRPKKGQFADLVEYLSEHSGQSGIIYCMSRRDTERLAARLMKEGIQAIFYHAGLDPVMRRNRQEQFINNEVGIVCATIAFGMGINKPDIRFVIHYNLPKSLEGYYQETGRAGRDNLPSDCILYYHPSAYHDMLGLIKSNDLPPEQFAIEEQKLKDLIEFCELRTCRRKYLLTYFDEDYADENCSGCDNCLHNSSEKTDPEEAIKILTALEDVDGRLSKRMFKYLISGYLGKQSRDANLDRERYFGICQKYDHKNYDRWIDELIELGCIGQDRENRNNSFITEKGRQVLEGNLSVELSDPLLVYRNYRMKYQKKASRVVTNSNANSGPIIQESGNADSNQSPALPHNSDRNQCPISQEQNDNSLFNQLRAVQKELFQREDYDFTKLFKNSVLKEIVNRMPLTNEEFLKISGVIPSDWDIYRDYYLETVIGFIEERASPEICLGDAEEPPEALQSVLDKDTPPNALQAGLEKNTPPNTLQAGLEKNTPPNALQAGLEKNTPPNTLQAGLEKNTPPNTLQSVLEKNTPPNTLQAVLEKNKPPNTLQAGLDKDTPPVTVIDGNDVLHQYDTVLYDELCMIRKEIAEENGIFETSVLFDKKLKELCMNYPCSESDLAILWPWAAPSFIHSKYTILVHISNYCNEHGITPPSVDSHSQLPRTKNLPEKSAYESLRLYREGNSISEIAKKRKISEYTISNHIAAIIRFDNSMDIEEFVDPDRIKIIRSAMEDVRDKYLKPVKEYLGEGYSYAEIKYVRAYLARCRELC